MQKLGWPSVAVSSLLVVFAVVSCGGEGPAENNNQQQNQGEQNQTPERPESLEERCQAACDRIYGDGDDQCDTRFTGEDGAVSRNSCVTRCTDENLFRGGEWCVATEAECTEEPEPMIEACLPDDYHVEACEHLGLWSRDHVEVEEEIVEYVNDHRTEGKECDGRDFEPVDAVEWNPELRCAARLYDVAWIENPEERNNWFDFEGEDAQQWAEDAGYGGEVVGTRVNHGERDADDLLQSWTTDDQNDPACELMMSDEADEIGFGYYEQQRGTAIFGKSN